jgi:hypothetical protein
MAGDYADGVWRYDTTTGWGHISNMQASQLKVDAAGDVYGQFADGIWRWSAATTGWQKLSSLTDKSTNLQVTGGGVLYASFGSAGTWRWSFAGWQQISTQVPTAMVVSNADAFFGSFSTGVAGLWRWTPTAGWGLLSYSRPDQMQTDNDGEVVTIYGASKTEGSPVGIWRWGPSVGWQLLSTDVPDAITVSTNDAIYENAGVPGIYYLAPGETTFTHVSYADASNSNLIALPNGGLFDQFSTNGVTFSGWYYNADVDVEAWTEVITNANVLQWGSGNDNDVFLNYGSGGVWQWGPSFTSHLIGSSYPAYITTQGAEYSAY